MERPPRAVTRLSIWALTSEGIVSLFSQISIVVGGRQCCCLSLGRRGGRFVNANQADDATGRGGLNETRYLPDHFHASAPAQRPPLRHARLEEPRLMPCETTRANLEPLEESGIGIRFVLLVTSIALDYQLNYRNDL